MDNPRERFIEKLDSVQQNVLRMGTLVEESIRKAMKSLVDKDIELAQRVITEDEPINQLEIDIQDECVAVIATEQPVASDLRTVITSIKITTQIERMGDHSRHIARTAMELSDQVYMKKLIDIPRMGEIIANMLHEVLTAYVNSDPEKAKEAAAMDDQIDTLHDQVLREVMTYMMQDPHNINQAISLLFVCRYLERLGDHVTNIAEWICYNSMGKHVELNK